MPPERLGRYLRDLQKLFDKYDYHGSLFEFVRNYKFNGRNFFASRPDFLKRNQFGGTIGGPGPVIVGGMMYTGSGYVVVGSLPGNVLLAFGVE